MFKKARLKLSLFYVLIIAIGMVIFSVVFYSYSVRDVEHDISHETGISFETQQRLIHHTLDKLQFGIVLADVAILIVLGCLSYVLAGKTLKPIQKALDSQERFSANASHELRTPLAVMKLENEIFLSEPNASADMARSLARSNLEEIDRMTGMTESLLLLARSKTTNQISIPKEPLDLSIIIESISKRLEKIHPTKNVLLSSIVNPELMVLGNRKLLEQALVNIVENAFAYTSSGSINITGTKTPDRVILSIQDSGIGISPADLKHIKEPFYKADQSRGQSSKRFGLGLSIVQEIMSLHRGTFSIQSTLGTGTLVTLELPRIRS